MAYASIANNAAMIDHYFNRRILEYVNANKVFMNLGDSKPLPQKQGKQAIFVKMNKLTPVTTAGTPGTPPTLKSLTSAQITVDVAQYKDGVGYQADLIDMGSVDGIEKIIRDLLGDQVTNSVDLITRNQLNSAVTNAIYAGDNTDPADMVASDKLTWNLVQLGELSFEASDVGPHKDGYYAFVGHPNTLFDMRTDTATGGWIDVNKYSDSGYSKMFPKGEIGACGKTRFLSTTNVYKDDGSVSDANAILYTNWMFGYQPFGVVKLDGYSFNLIHHKPGSSGVADPCNELGSLAWNIWYASKYFGGDAGSVTDPERAIKIVSAHGAA